MKVGEREGKWDGIKVGRLDGLHVGRFDGWYEINVGKTLGRYVRKLLGIVVGGIVTWLSKIDT